MDSLKSLKGYNKMDPSEDLQFRRKTNNRLILIAATILLLLLFLAILAGVTISISFHKQNTKDIPFSPQSPKSPSSSIKAICRITPYPDSCFTSLTSNSSTIPADATSLFHLSLSVAFRSISKLSPFLSTLNIPSGDTRLRAAIDDCNELLDDALGRLNDSTATARDEILSDRSISDIKTWLSAAITDLDTCLAGFEGAGGGFREKLEAAMVDSMEFASNSLAIAAGVLGVGKDFHFPINR